MKCQKCGSENVNVQLINKQELMNLKERKGCLWWVAIGGYLLNGFSYTLF